MLGREPITDRTLDLEPGERFDLADLRLRQSRDVVSGAIFSSDLDLSHPLAFGYHRREIASHRDTSIRLVTADNAVATVARYHSSPLLAGYASQRRQDEIGGSPMLVAERLGEGTVVLMADNPDFRGICLGTAPRRASVAPDVEVRDPPKLGVVPRHERHLVDKRGGGDPEVVGPDEQVLVAEVAERAAVPPGHVAVRDENLEAPEEALPSAPFMHTRPAGQLAGGSQSDAEACFWLGLQERERRTLVSPGLALEIHQKGGLEDQPSFHLSFGGRSSVFASSTRSRVSSSKSAPSVS